MNSKAKKKSIGEYMSKTSLMVAAGMVATSLFAAEQCCPVTYRPAEPIDCNELKEGTLYPADYFLCGDSCVNYYVAGEYLYWQFKRDGSRSEEIGQLQEPVGNVTTSIQLRNSLKYQSGFRLTAGVNLPGFDHWQSQMVYTWFHGSNSTTKSTAVPNFVIQKNGITITPQPTGFESVNSNYHNKWNFLSWTLGRPTYFGQRLILNPMIGLKGYWAKESDVQTFTGPGIATGSIVFSGEGFGIGPYAGLDLKGLIWCDFYVLGRFAVTEMLNKYSKNNQILNFPSVPNTTGNSFTSFKRSQRQMATFWESNIGLGWGSYFCNNSYHADLSFTWDFMTFLDRLAMPSYAAMTEVYFQGLSVKAQFDF